MEFFFFVFPIDFQAPKKDTKSSAKQPQKTQKKKEGGGGGKAKKKKWSKGKVRDKLNNQVLFDKPTYEKLYKEVPQYKLITPSIVSERLKIRGSLARRALIELRDKGTFKKRKYISFFNHFVGQCVSMHLISFFE